MSHKFKIIEAIIKNLSQLKSASDDKYIRKLINRLKKTYNNSGEITRYKIVNGVIEIRLPEALPLLKKVLVKDESELIRHEAAFGIGVLGNSDHISLLVKTLKNDPSVVVRHEAALALSSVGNYSCLKHLEIVRKKDVGFVASSAKYAIVCIRSKQFQKF